MTTELNRVDPAEGKQGAPRSSQAYLSVCAIYRDEAPYLREWVEFHRIVGVERFFLYDHASVDDHRAALAPYIEDGLVTVHDLPDVPDLQFEIYSRCLEEHRGDARWIAFIDIDEFLFSPSGNPLPDLLAEFESWPGLAANWAMYGTSGHRSRPAGLVIDNYLWRGEPEEFGAARQFKCIVDPQRATKCESSHWFHFTEGSMVDEHKQPLSRALTEQALYERIRLNHYFTRSEEECVRKFARPRVNDSALMGGGEAPLEHLHMQLNSLRDDAIVQYVPAVKAALAKTNERAPFDSDAAPLTWRHGSPPDTDATIPEESRNGWGSSAVSCIEMAVESARRLLPANAEGGGWTGRVLVFPCGRGLAVRAMRAAFPGAEIVASDLEQAAMDFCAEAYATASLPAGDGPAAIEAAGPFDLIWCGSLFTHLEAERWQPYLESLERALRPWGLLLFGTNGDYIAAGVGPPKVEPGRSAELRGEYARMGFVHEHGDALQGSDDYEGRGLAHLGTALSSAAWTLRQLEARPGLRLLMAAEQGWIRHHDVFAVARAGAWAVVRDLFRSDPAITEERLVELTGYPREKVSRLLATLKARAAEADG